MQRVGVEALLEGERKAGEVGELKQLHAPSAQMEGGVSARSSTQMMSSADVPNSLAAGGNTQTLSRYCAGAGI